MGQSGRCGGTIADVPTPDRCAVEIESRCFNVCICISSRLPGRLCDDSLPACGNERKPSSCFGGDRSADFGNCDPVDLRLAPGGVNRQVIQRDWCRLRRSDRADGWGRSSNPVVHIASSRTTPRSIDCTKVIRVALTSDLSVELAAHAAEGAH